jgi:hypothetical protein
VLASVQVAQPVAHGEQTRFVVAVQATLSYVPAAHTAHDEQLVAPAAE